MDGRRLLCSHAGANAVPGWNINEGRMHKQGYRRTTAMLAPFPICIVHKEGRFERVINLD